MTNKEWQEQSGYGNRLLGQSCIFS